MFEAVGVKPWWDSDYTVHVDLANAGGLYTDASVTYRGVDVGKVTGVHLLPNQVVADLSIHHGVKIPQNAYAAVKELTAASEQYIDLSPTNNDPPYLTTGYTIPMDRTSVPVTVATSSTRPTTWCRASRPAISTPSARPSAKVCRMPARISARSSSTAEPCSRPSSPPRAGRSLIDSGNTVLNTLNNTSNEFSDFAANLKVLSPSWSSPTAISTPSSKTGPGQHRPGQVPQQHAASPLSLIDHLATISNLAIANGRLQRPAPGAAGIRHQHRQHIDGRQIRFELDFNTKNTVCPYTTQMAEPTSLGRHRGPDPQLRHPGAGPACSGGPTRLPYQPGG